MSTRRPSKTAFPELPTAPIRTDLAYLDVEASSLFDGFPVEFGWSLDDLRPESLLVRPHSSWARTRWSPASEEVHGLTWERLMDEGLDAEDVASRLNAALSGTLMVMSDNVSHDRLWTSALFAAAGFPAEFRIETVMGCVPAHAKVTVHNLREWEVRFAKAQDLAERSFPHPHRAGPDAVRMAAAFRFAFDAGYAERAEAWLLPPSRRSGAGLLGT